MRDEQGGHYGCTWACPPGVGTIEERKERIQRYTNAFVFTTKYDIEDSFDYEDGGRGKWHDQVSQKLSLGKITAMNFSINP